jgi:hypothetical protein
VVGGDKLVALIHLGCLPVVHPLQKPGEAGVDAAVPAQHKAHPVAARLDLAARAGAAAGLLDCFSESFRPGGAELDRQNRLHPTDPKQRGLHPRAGLKASPSGGTATCLQLALVRLGYGFDP